MTPPARQWIGKYEKVRNEPIGSGGFGSVFLAYDHRMERQVAIKTLDAPDDPALLARFRAEARALAALQHPNIVIIFETGEDQGRQYLVMEYVDGRTLKDLMGDRNPMPLWRKVEIMAQVADALECAHRHGIVHRDVKPANIMVRREDGAVKMLDFGIARLARSDNTRTESGLLMGTIPYMAPEQFDEGGGDALCDLWAYGIVYYELLTGRHPFGNQDTKPFAMASRIREQECDPVGAVLPDCPPALERLVGSLLKKRREERLPSFAEVQFEVQPLLVELKKQHAASLANRAEEQLDAGNFDGVVSAIRTILSLDPTSPSVPGLRERLQQARRQRDRRSQATSLVQSADMEASQGRLAEAIQLLEQAQRVDPTSSDLTTRIESLRAAQKQAELTRRLVSEARRELEASHLTEAFKAATGALSADRQDAEAAALLEEIRKQIEQRERQRNLQRGLNRARGQIAIKSFEDALALLGELAAQYPGAAGVDLLIQEARRQQEERDRREKLAAGIDAARDLIRRQALPEAVQALEALAASFPGEKEPADLLSYARDELAAREAHTRAQETAGEAEALARKLQFDAALQLLEKALQTYPGEECLPRAMRLVLAARAEHERERALEDGLVRARRMSQQGALEDGLSLAAALERDYPGRSEPVALREELQREQAAVRQRNLERLLGQAAAREKAGDLKGALHLLEDAVEANPNAAELNQALDAVRQRKAAAERQSAVAASCAEIERLLGAGQFPTAREALERARRSSGGDPRFDALQQKVEQAQLRHNQLSAAEKLMRDRDFGRAEENLTALLRMDSQDEMARTMLDSLGQLRAREQRREAGRREAAQCAEGGKFEDAVRAFDRLLKEFPGDAALQGERQAAREAADRAREEGVARVRAEAAEGLRNQDFDRAIRQLEALEKEFPGIPQIAYDLRFARAARQDFERQKVLAAGRGDAERLLAARNFKAAIERYQALVTQFPNDPMLGEELRSAQAAREEFERRQTMAAGLKEARRLAGARNFKSAIERYQALAAQFPNDPLVAEELRSAQAAKDDIERKQALAAGVDEARRLTAARNFDAAIQRYQSLAAQFPNDPLVAEELRSAQAAKDDIARKQALAAGVDEARRLTAARNFDAAIQRYQALVGQFPNDPLLAEELRSAQAAKDDIARKQTLAAGIEEARRLAAARNFDAAIQRYQSLVAQFPNDPIVGEELKSVERKKALSAGIDEARRLAAARNFDAAIQRYQSLVAQFPNDPQLAEELADVARKQALAAGIEEARRLAAARNFDAAIQRYQSLVAQFPNDPQLAEELADVARKQALAVGREEARRLAAARNFDAAIQRYQALVGQFPNDRQLAEELADVARKQALAVGREEARQLATARNFEAAIQRYQTLAAQFPNDPLLAEELRSAQTAKDDIARKQALAVGREEARQLATARDFDAAIQRYQTLVAQFPNDPFLAEELRSAQAAKQRSERDAQAIQHESGRKEALGAGLDEARRLAGARNFDAAIQRYQALIAHFPNLPLLGEELRSVEAARQESERQQALGAGLDEARRLVAARNFDAAVQRYQALVAQFPNDPLPAEELRSAKAAQGRSQIEQLSSRGRAEAAEALRNLDFDRAIATLQALQEKFPGDPQVAEDCKTALAAKEEFERKRALATGRAEARRLLTERRFDAAIQRYQGLVAQFPDDPLLAEELRSAQAAQYRSQSTELAGRGRAEAAGWLRNQEFERALRRLQDLGRQFPDDTQVHYDYEAALTAKEEFERRQAVAAGRADAQRLLAERKFDAALQRYQLLMVQFPNDPLLPDELREAHLAKSRYEEKEQIARGRADAAELLRRKEIDRALGLLESLARKFPNDLGLAEDLREARQSKDETIRRQTYQRGLAEAEASLTSGSLDEAIRRYEALRKQYPEDAAVREGLAAAQAAKAAKATAGRKQVYLRALAEADGLVTAGSFDEALRRYEALAKQYPEEAAVREGLAAARTAKASSGRKHAYQRALAEAEGLATAGSFDEAIRRYEALWTEHPGDAAIRDGLTAAKAAKNDSDRKQVYQRARAEAEGLVTAGSFEEAIRRYEALLKEYPGDAALRDGLASAKAARTDAGRKQAYQRGRAEAERLSREANFDAAIGVLENLLQQFAGDRALQDDLQIARRARDLQEQRLRMDGRVAQLEKLRAGGDAASVKKEAKRLLAETEEPRARALLQWAEATLAGTAPDRQAKKLTWVWATLPAVAVAAFGVVWWSTHRPPPPASLNLAPQKIAFAWKPGNRPPDPKKVTVRAKGGAVEWTGTSEADWLIAEPAAGSASDLNLSINTSKVNVPTNGPAEYSGMVKVSGGGVEKWVSVTLSVLPVANTNTAVIPPPALEVAPTELTFHWKQQTPLPEPKTVYIHAHGGQVNWKFTTRNLLWLSATLTADQSQLVVSVNPSRATALHHSELLQIASGDTTRQVQVNLIVEPAAANGLVTGGTVIPPDRKPGDRTGNAVIPPPPPPPKAEPPLRTAADVVDCHGPEFAATHPSNSGRLQWTGQLPPGATLWLGRDPSWTDPNGPSGSWKGKPFDRLPGCAVDVASSGGLSMVETPSAGNNYSRLELKNTSSQPINSLTIQWTVK